MSFPIQVDIARRRAAQQFAQLLTATMRQQKIGRRTLAGSLGMTSNGGIIAWWRTGNTLPSLESAGRLAEALGEPRLLALVRAARTHTCERLGCNTTFVHESAGAKRFCSPNCGKLEGKRQQMGPPSKARATEAEAGMAMRMLAIADFCGGCEPEGYCRDAGCSLRVVSPLPLRTDPRADPEMAIPAPGPYGSPENRERTIAAIRQGNARRWAAPEARREQSDRSRQMHVARRAAVAERSRVEETARTIIAAAECGAVVDPELVAGEDLVELARFALSAVVAAARRRPA